MRVEGPVNGPADENKCFIAMVSGIPETGHFVKLFCAPPWKNLSSSENSIA